MRQQKVDHLTACIDKAVKRLREIANDPVLREKAEAELRLHRSNSIRYIAAIEQGQADASRRDRRDGEKRYHGVS